MTSCRCKARLSIFSLSMALGLLSGLTFMLMAWYAYWSGRGVSMIAPWSEVYTGYAPTIQGGLIGGAWGFFDGFISGLVFAILYNLFLCLSRGFSKDSNCCCNGPSTNSTLKHDRL